MNNRGYSLIEIVLSAAVLLIAIGAFANAIIYGQGAVADAGSYFRATALAEEGLEATRSIRDSAFANLTAGTHGLQFTSNQWSFNGSFDTNGVFTREIIIGEIDADRRVVTSTVSWVQPSQRDASISLVTWLTNWAGASTVGNWASPSATSTINLTGNENALKVQISGDYAYVIRDGGAPDFAVVNISNAASPTVVYSTDLTGVPVNIHIAGNYAYIANSSNAQELQILDISTPSSPSVVGTYDATGNADPNGVFAVGTTVYLTRDSSTSNELVIINASTPASPTLSGSLDLGVDGNEVVVSGNYAYIATNSTTQELMVVNISNPASLSINGSLNLTGTDTGLSITHSGSTVYMGMSNGTVAAINITTPTTPALLDVHSTGDAVQDLAIGLNYLFVATDNNSPEFYVLDVSTPSSMVEYGTYNASGDINGVAYSTDYDLVVAVTDINNSEVTLITPQ